MTRATLALLRGDIAGAVRFHPLVFVTLPTLALFFGINTLKYLRTGRWGYVDGQMGKGFGIAAGLMVTLSIGVWVARFLGAFGGPVPVD